MSTARVTEDLLKGMIVILQIDRHLDHRKTFYSRLLDEVGVAATINPKYLTTIHLIIQGQGSRRKRTFLISNRRRVMKANQNKNNGAGQQRKSQLQKQNQWLLNLYLSPLIHNLNIMRIN